MIRTSECLKYWYVRQPIRSRCKGKGQWIEWKDRQNRNDSVLGDQECEKLTKVESLSLKVYFVTSVLEQGDINRKINCSWQLRFSSRWSQDTVYGVVVTVVRLQDTWLDTVFWPRYVNMVNKSPSCSGCICDDLCISFGSKQVLDGFFTRREKVFIEVSQ